MILSVFPFHVLYYIPGWIFSMPFILACLGFMSLLHACMYRYSSESESPITICIRLRRGTNKFIPSFESTKIASWQLSVPTA
ncbi:hypothetical protein BJX70DRAFT_315247 [Aspergillus crustosus]